MKSCLVVCCFRREFQSWICGGFFTKARWLQKSYLALYPLEDRRKYWCPMDVSTCPQHYNQHVMDSYLILFKRMHFKWQILLQVWSKFTQDCFSLGGSKSSFTVTAQYPQVCKAGAQNYTSSLCINCCLQMKLVSSELRHGKSCSRLGNSELSKHCHLWGCEYHEGIHINSFRDTTQPR